MKIHGKMVVQVVQEFSVKGGIEAVVYELQNAMNKLNLPSKVVAGIAPDQERRDDVELIHSIFRNSATRGKFGKYFGRLLVITAFTIKATKHVRRKYANEVILNHGHTLFCDALVIHAVNKASLRAKTSKRWLLNPMHFLVGARDRYLIGGLRCKLYIAVSNRVAQELMDFYKVPSERIVVIPNGVNTDRFTPDGPGRPAIRLSLGIPKSAPVLLFVGHEFERKGLAFVIDALRMLPPDYYLIVVGNDNPQPYLKMIEQAGATKRVLFLGPRSDLPEIYRASDLFVFPSSYEAFGLVAIEALSSGIPILSTRVGGIEDYLIDGVNGYFIERNGKSIAEGVFSVFEDDEKFAAMSKAARGTAMNYTWEKIAQQYYYRLMQLK